MHTYIDRSDAGAILAKYLQQYADAKNTLVLALPRGGVPVAYEVAKQLHLPLDVFLVRKLGVPGHEEFAFGALASGNSVYLNEDILRQLSISPTSIQQVQQAEQAELQRREQVYRGNKPYPNLQKQTVILIDDGIATGATMKAAILSLRKQHPQRIIIAVPVAALSSCKELAEEVDEVICPLQPIDFHAVGLWYMQFDQTSDAEVIELLQKAQLA